MRNTSAKDACELLPKQQISAPQKNSKERDKQAHHNTPNKFLFLNSKMHTLVHLLNSLTEFKSHLNQAFQRITNNSSEGIFAIL